MRILPLLLVLALAGCAETIDPYVREGVWRPAGVNDHNLRAMVAVPQEIIGGTGADGANGEAASEAIARLRTDRVRPLIEASSLRTAPGGN